LLDLRSRSLIRRFAVLVGLVFARIFLTTFRLHTTITGKRFMTQQQKSAAYAKASGLR
jgi:hypothetical protein